MGRHDGIERELKWMLDAAGHARLAHELGRRWGQPRLLPQENRFYDSADGRLRSAGMSIRLRREAGRLVVTGKRRSAERAGALHAYDEDETRLSAALWPAIAAGADPASVIPLPAAQRQRLAGAALVSLGGFTNLRLAWLTEGCEVCLDRTEYPGQRCDYELEVEILSGEAAEHEARWQARLTALGLPVQAQVASKLQRLVAILGEAPVKHSGHHASR